MKDWISFAISFLLFVFGFLGGVVLMGYMVGVF